MTELINPEILRFDYVDERIERYRTMRRDRDREGYCYGCSESFNGANGLRSHQTGRFRGARCAPAAATQAMIEAAYDEHEERGNELDWDETRLQRDVSSGLCAEYLLAGNLKLARKYAERWQKYDREMLAWSNRTLASGR